MNSNLHSIDRLLRLLLGLALVVLSLLGVIGVWGWAGLILVATALINFCPLYRLLGISTRR